jgi:tetratricopeptide (TPR) repeat protein
MMRWAVLLFCTLLAACASTPPPAVPEQLFRDDLFSAPAQPIRADDIFALTDEMKRYVDVEISQQLRSKGPQKGLLDALYSKQQLKLEYDSERTRNAAEAFEARAGNCLSLVIMTAALAKHLDLQVSYQSVYTDEVWTRSHDTYFASGHVNLTLGRRWLETTNRGTQLSWTIDFLPPEDLAGQRSRQVSEDTIVAMFMNNRAAETMAAGQLDAAYWWARAALERTPGFLNSYNTLGVIYMRRGQPALAEATLKHLLQRDPTSTVAMSNLSRLLEMQGRLDESRALDRQLAKIDPEPPYHFFELGQAAMKAGDALAARDWFAKEVSRAPYHSEFHFWLAVADFRLGLVEEARKHLSVALQNSTRRSEKQLYAAKLDYLRQMGVQ